MPTFDSQTLLRRVHHNFFVSIPTSQTSPQFPQSTHFHKISRNFFNLSSSIPLEPSNLAFSPRSSSTNSLYSRILSGGEQGGSPVTSCIGHSLRHSPQPTHASSSINCCFVRSSLSFFSFTESFRIYILPATCDIFPQ